jgi:hypothetical protein
LEPPEARPVGDKAERSSSWDSGISTSPQPVRSRTALLVIATLGLSMAVSAGAILWAKRSFNAPPPQVAGSSEEQDPEPLEVAATEAERASVIIETSPPAQIRVNGEDAGFSPVTLSNLEPGVARVKVYDSVKGFSKEQAFMLKPGDNGVRRVVVGLGTLELRIQPSATVILDGRNLGRTPLEPLSLYEGMHGLKLESAELNKTVLVPVRIEAGETRVLHLDLAAP